MQITREFLSQYIYLESEIKRIDRRLEYYRDHPLISEHGVVKGSMGQFPYAECHLLCQLLGSSLMRNGRRRSGSL